MIQRLRWNVECGKWKVESGMAVCFRTHKALPTGAGENNYSELFKIPECVKRNVELYKLK